MSVLFSIYDDSNTSVSFDTDEACDTGQTKPWYSIEMSQEKTATGVIKQQIRPGVRFVKTYEMNLVETKYISFIRLITNNSDYYYIQYTNVPSLLANDSSIITKNDFKISFTIDNVTSTIGEGIIYKFNLTIMAVNLQ